MISGSLSGRLRVFVVAPVWPAAWHKSIREMKQLIVIIMVLAGSLAYSQRSVPPTDTLFISGKIKKAVMFRLADLDTFPKSRIKGQVIYNHKGEIKDTISGMRGVALKAVLAPLDYVYEKPKTLNEFYFVLTASDGYKVVFSWNEIYNTQAGNEFFIVTEMKGKKGKEVEQRIVFISTADIKTGRRYIKGLRTIEVKQVE